MPLSGIQYFRPIRNWIPDQNRFGNDIFGTFAKASDGRISVKKIIVIDDDIQCNRMVCRILENAGHEVRAAFNGAEGLKMFLNERPDLVITDLYMPEKDGLETIMELRQTDQKIKILAISGGALNINVDEMLNTAEMFGADAIMAKPVHLETFLLTVKGLLDE
jgi:DNA-binding response OmpR family regulator